MISSNFINTIFALLSCIAFVTPGFASADWDDQGPADSRPTTADISAAIRDRWTSVLSLAVDYDETTEPLTDFRYTKKFLHKNSLIRYQVSFAIKSEKRYYKFINLDKFVIDPAPDVDPDYAVTRGGPELKKQLDSQRAGRGSVPARPRSSGTLANPGKEASYDGAKVYKIEPGPNGFDDLFSSTYVIMNPYNVKSEKNVFKYDYLNNISLMPANPLDPKDDRASERIYDAIKGGGYDVGHALEAVDGSPCIVVSRPGIETYWLDPKLNYAMRKHEIVDAAANVLVERRTNRDFAQVLPGLWLPKLCWRDECGPPLAPEQFRGVPLLRHVYRVKNLTINDVPDSRFALKPKPGYSVADASRLPRKDGANQYVTYRMPADAGMLDEAARHAIEVENRASAREQSARSNTLKIVLVNCCGLVVYLIARRLKARRP